MPSQSLTDEKEIGPMTWGQLTCCVVVWISGVGLGAIAFLLGAHFWGALIAAWACFTAWIMARHSLSYHPEM